MSMKCYCEKLETCNFCGSRIVFVQSCKTCESLHFVCPVCKNTHDLDYVRVNGNVVSANEKLEKHSTSLKKIINPVLRFVQFWTSTPYVIASKIDKSHGFYIFVGYIFKRVTYFGKPWGK